MKLLIASDIHGSAYYCNKLIEAYKRENAERMLLLGDILYHGPRNDLPQDYDPKRVASMLNEHRAETCSVRGNCDAEVDQLVLEFPMFADYALIFVRDRKIFAAHGHQPEPVPMLLCDDDIVLSGHSHVPQLEHRGIYVYMNPGSVSLPNPGSVHAYMTLETDTGEFRWLDLSGECFNEYRMK